MAPLVNIYSQGDPNVALKNILPQLKKYIAQRLTCSDIALSSKEVSIRFLKVAYGDMISAVEVEITAHAFPERVHEQDQICLDVMAYIKKHAQIDAKVWLKLPELGHSWE